MQINIVEVLLKHTASGAMVRGIISSVANVEEAKAKCLRGLRDIKLVGRSAAWDVLRPLAANDADWVTLSGQLVTAYESESTPIPTFVF